MKIIISALLIASLLGYLITTFGVLLSLALIGSFIVIVGVMIIFMSLIIKE